MQAPIREILMKIKIEEIMRESLDQQEIMSVVKANLHPILQARKEEGEEYFNRLSVCLGYQMKKVEKLKTIITTFFAHDTIKKSMDKNEITRMVEGIVSFEADVAEVAETARTFYADTTFNSVDQRDASYLMACMKLIIEGCLLTNFVAYVSNNKTIRFSTFPQQQLGKTFEKTLGEFTGKAFQELVQGM